MKIVYNACFGGFGLSDEAFDKYKKIKGDDAVKYNRDIPRDCHALISIVEEMGDKASDRYAQLEIQEIPDGAQWEIDEYDGTEQVVPPRQSW